MPAVLGTRARAMLGSVRIHPLRARVDIQDFTLVTHAVPAGRVRPHVPDGLSLQTFVDSNGTEMALVSVASFCNRDLQPVWAPYPRHSFEQITFRTYVTHGDRVGLWFFGSHVNTGLSWGGQWILAKGTRLASVSKRIDRSEQGYRSFGLDSEVDDERVSLRIEAEDQPSAAWPFVTAGEMLTFLTLRLHGFSEAPGGLHTYGPIEHRVMDPVGGRLVAGRCDFWDRLGIVTPEEFATPQSVLIEPEVRFILKPPRPIRLRT